VAEAAATDDSGVCVGASNLASASDLALWESADDGKPVAVELRKGDWPRLIFRRTPGHRYDEVWPNRGVRVAPRVDAVKSGRLAYFTDIPDSCSHVIQIILRDHGYQRDEELSASCAVYWCSGQLNPKVLASLLPHQRVNKLPAADALTDKSKLWLCYHAMQAAHGDSVFGFAPRSFVLPDELEDYEDHLRETFEDGEEMTWILKPSSQCRGQGIFLHRPTMLQSGKDNVFPPQVKRHVGVACEYVDPPLLIEGLKFDLRLFVLVTSVQPLVVYFYDEGLTRFATEAYDIELGLRDLCMHLTNASINKRSDKYESTQEGDEGSGSKWSLSALKQRLRQEVGEARAFQTWLDVDDLVVKTIISAECAFSAAIQAALPAAGRGQPVRQCFQIFGFDVMLDANAKPWLLEVNCDPQMKPTSALDLKIKAGVLIDTLNVVGMPLPPPWAEDASSINAEETALHIVNTEYARSKSTSWRRLLPSTRSAEYLPLLKDEHGLNQLPFDGTRHGR